MAAPSASGCIWMISDQWQHGRSPEDQAPPPGEDAFAPAAGRPMLRYATRPPGRYPYRRNAIGNGTIECLAVSSAMPNARYSAPSLHPRCLSRVREFKVVDNAGSVARKSVMMPRRMRSIMMGESPTLMGARPCRAQTDGRFFGQRRSPARRTEGHLPQEIGKSGDEVGKTPTGSMRPAKLGDRDLAGAGLQRITLQ